LDAYSRIKAKSNCWWSYQSSFGQCALKRKEIWRKIIISLPITKEKRIRNNQKRRKSSC